MSTCKVANNNHNMAFLMKNKLIISTLNLILIAETVINSV